MNRNASYEFISHYLQPEYYLSRCFASLFPYGRGCPSDQSIGVISIAKHTAHMLTMGGGPHPRRFQQSSNYIFTTYNMEMKRKMGGVAYIAQRKKIDGTILVEESAPTVGEIIKLISYLEETENTSIDTENINITMTQNNFQNIVDNDINTRNIENINNEKEMQKLMQRLIPYAKSLQGTAPHIAHERSKLMAMIPSPIINDHGVWRYFFTTAPADLYENRLYEVIQSPITDDNISSWNLRMEKVGYKNIM